MAKVCTKCKIEKNLEDFGTKSSGKDGKGARCKECENRVKRERRSSDPEAVRARDRAWHANNRDRRNARTKAYYVENSAKMMAQMKEFLKSNPEHGLWKLAKGRAKKHGIPFTITKEDINIPEFCPVLGMKLAFGDMQSRESSPSLDKIVPELGYVKGNIAVISYRANKIKNDGSSDEHRRIADWMDSFAPPN